MLYCCRASKNCCKNITKCCDKCCNSCGDICDGCCKCFCDAFGDCFEGIGNCVGDFFNRPFSFCSCLAFFVSGGPVIYGAIGFADSSELNCKYPIRTHLIITCK